MKLNKIFATAAATVAMFTMNATQAIADMYHAQKVECTMGTSDETTIGMVKLGVTADSCEVWGCIKNTDKYAYFRCNIDGTDYTVSATNIDANKVHDLGEMAWYKKPLLRRLPTEEMQTLFVKVAGKSSDNNKFMAWNYKADWLEGVDALQIVNGKVDMQVMGTPVYNAETDTYSQEIRWTMKDVYKDSYDDTYVCASFDGGPWKMVNSVNTYSEENSVTVTIPGNVKNVRYVVQAYIKIHYVAIFDDYYWSSQESETYELTKSSDAKQKSFMGEEESTTSGIDNVNNAEQGNAPVDIYTISGERVAQNASLKDAATTLNRGIYVVNGKKVMMGK